MSGDTGYVIYCLHSIVVCVLLFHVINIRLKETVILYSNYHPETNTYRVTCCEVSQKEHLLSSDKPLIHLGDSLTVTAKKFEAEPSTAVIYRTSVLFCLEKETHKSTAARRWQRIHG